MEQVDDARQLVLGADGKLDGDTAVGQLRARRLEHTEEVGALAVEHVHEHDARELVLLGARPDAQAVDLDAHDAAEDDESAFDDAQRRVRVRLKAGVAGAVDEVDLAVVPVEVRERPRERHLAPVLVVLPVADGRSLLDRPEPVRLPGLEQQRLDERGLADSAMADDGDVADLSRLGSRHLGRILLEICRFGAIVSPWVSARSALAGRRST